MRDNVAETWRDDLPRLVAACSTCGESVDVPNKGLGRAVLNAWLTRHQGHEVTR